jgi:PAS domain S-box-containing protein
MLGYSEEGIGQSAFELVHPDDREYLLRLFAGILQKPGQVVVPPTRIRHADGSWHWIEGVANNLLAEPSVQAVVINFRDITERERAEEAQARLTADLERSNRELEQFAYVASHDLQEPLRMVHSYTQLLGRRYKGKLDADADEFIAFAVDGASRMQRLISDLLAYSRVGTRGKEFAPTNCETIVDQALTNLQVAIQESGATITRDPLPTLMADDVQLVQLFQNLIGNAIKFHGAAPPHVHVSAQKTSEVSKTSEVWKFSVRDNGIGIDMQFAGRIFGIFQRLHARGEYPGTGIGLAICQRIVERHDGRIWVESEPGKGSTFYFTIPADS